MSERGPFGIQFMPSVIFASRVTLIEMLTNSHIKRSDHDSFKVLSIAVLQLKSSGNGRL